MNSYNVKKSAMQKKQVSKLVPKVVLRKRGIYEVDLKLLSKRERLVLTRMLDNVYCGRLTNYGVTYSSPIVNEYVKRVSEMPRNQQRQEINNINKIVFRLNLIQK